MKFRQLFFLMLFASLFTVPLVVSAQAQPAFVPLTPVSGSSLNYTSSTTLASFINTVFTIAISIGAMLAVLRLVYAGYIYMISGVGSFVSQTKAREIISDVAIGLFLLLAIFLILQQINPQILNNLNVNSLNSGTPSGPTTSGASPTPVTPVSTPQIIPYTPGSSQDVPGPGCYIAGDGGICGSGAVLTVGHVSGNMNYCCPSP